MDKRPIQEGATGPLHSPTMSSDDEESQRPFFRQSSEDLSLLSPNGGEDLDYPSRLFRAVLPLFTRYIPATDFMDSPHISALLTDPQMERVHRKSEVEGNSSAARCLLNFIKSKANWFDRILDTLDQPELKLQDFKPRFLLERDKVNKESYSRRRAASAQGTAKKGPYITSIPVVKNNSLPTPHAQTVSRNVPHPVQQSSLDHSITRPNFLQLSTDNNVSSSSRLARSHPHSPQPAMAQMTSPHAAVGPTTSPQAGTGQLRSPQTAMDQMTSQTAKSQMTSQTAMGQMTSQTAKGQMTSQTAMGQMTSQTAMGRMTSQTAKSQMTPQTAKSQMTPQTAKSQMTPQTAKSQMTPQTAMGRMTSQTAMGRMTSQTAKSQMTPQTAMGRMTSQTAKSQMTSQTAMGQMTSQTAMGRMTSQTAKSQMTPQTAMGRMTSQTAKSQTTPQTAMGRMTSQTAMGQMTSQTAMGQMTSQTAMGQMTSQTTMGQMTSQTAMGQMTSQTAMGQMPSPHTAMGRLPSGNRTTQAQAIGSPMSQHVIGDRPVAVSVQKTTLASQQMPSTLSPTDQFSSAISSPDQFASALSSTGQLSSASKQPSSEESKRHKGKEKTLHNPGGFYHNFDDPHSVDKFSWYHGEMGRPDAERLLQEKPTGSFLIRRSQIQNHYTLSIRDEGRTVHIRVDEKADRHGQVKYGLAEATTTRFISIVALVNYYSTHDVAVTKRGTCLLHPVPSQLV